MLVDLTPEEATFILSLLKEHLIYYRMLAGNPRCSDRTLLKKALVEKLVHKLENI